MAFDSGAAAPYSTADAIANGTPGQSRDVLSDDIINPRWAYRTDSGKYRCRTSFPSPTTTNRFPEYRGQVGQLYMHLDVGMAHHERTRKWPIRRKSKSTWTSFHPTRRLSGRSIISTVPTR